ncbi:MAG: AAA family ATPase [Salinisphaera sp.]|jgi:RecA-family ATPase|nr:AAA family ATPase [Salinisphaera sp.]
MGEAIKINPQSPIEPLCDPNAIGVSDMLRQNPPERRWLVDGLVPAGIVGAVSAAGGAGKTFLIMQMGVSVSCGAPFMGASIPDPGGVLMLTAEDDRDEIHRRLWAIVQSMKFDGDLTDADIELIESQFFIDSRIGRDDRLTREIDRDIEPTLIGDRIIALVQQLERPIKLIVLDPLSRFRGGEENSNSHATAFVRQVERIARETGATVLVAHHVAKNTWRASDGLHQDGMRGASALIDGFRFGLGMATLRKDEASKFNVDPDDARQYVRAEPIKQNGGAMWDGAWLKRGEGGVLALTDLQPKKSGKSDAEAEDCYQDTVAKLKTLVRRAQESGNPLTMRRLRDYAGRGGVFDMGDQRLRGMAKRAIQESHISEHTPEGATHAVLRTWK